MNQPIQTYQPTVHSRLTESKTALTAQLNEVQTQTQLSGSSAVPLKLELERVKTELGSVTTHSDWLSKELTARKRNRLFSYGGYIEIMSRGTELPGR